MEEQDDDLQEVWYFEDGYGCPEDRETGDYFLETLLGGIAVLGILAIFVAWAAGH